MVDVIWKNKLNTKEVVEDISTTTVYVQARFIDANEPPQGLQLSLKELAEAVKKYKPILDRLK